MGERSHMAVRARRLEDDDCDSAVAPSKVAVGFQARIGFEERPGAGIRGRPVFAEDAGSDRALVLKFTEVLLNGDADVSASSAGTVAVDEFENRAEIPAGLREFPIELCERVANQGFAFLEVDRGDGWVRVASLAHGSEIRRQGERVNPWD